MARVVDAEEVSDEDVPLLLPPLRPVHEVVEVSPDPPVHGVQVPDVEGGVGVGGGEGVGEEAQPRVVAGEHDTLAAAVAELGEKEETEVQVQ